VESTAATFKVCGVVSTKGLKAFGVDTVSFVVVGSVDLDDEADDV